MGQTSSQLAASQVPTTQDVPLTSQSSTQIPDMDALDKPNTLKRVASTMDDEVENTVKKARRKMRARNGPSVKRKSVPQHMRGHAIQPSQEIPVTQEDEQAGAGAEEEDVEPVGVTQEDKNAGAEVVVPQSSAPKAKAKGKKKRLQGNEDDVEPTVHDAIADEGALEELDLNTVDQGKLPSPAQPKKRKRKHLELERLKKDAEDFSPHDESTPKPKPVTKRQRRSKDVPQAEIIEEQPEEEAIAQPVLERVKPQKRSKATKTRARDVADSQEAPKGTSKAKSKRSQAWTAVNAEAHEPQEIHESDSAAPQQHGPAPSAEPNNVPNGTEAEDFPYQPATVAQPSNAEGATADGILTPPESPGDEAQNHAQTNGNANNEAAANVDTEAEHQMQDANIGGVQEASTSAAPTAKNKKSKKRKRVLENLANGEQANEDEDGDADDAKAAKERSSRRKKYEKVTKAHDDTNNDEDFRENDIHDADSDVSNEDGKKRSKKAPKSKKQNASSSDEERKSKKERGQIQGTWSEEEKELADEVFNGVVRTSAIPAWELKANIIDWKNPTPALRQFKEEMHEAFPKRDFKSITRFCQRRYNAYERGKWTAEEDQRLREGYELFPDQWTDISDHVGRFWEDCRMRWRDVLSRPSKAVTGPWSRKEEIQLAKAVQACRELIIKETEDDEIGEDPAEADALISWKVVAAKMGDTRTAKRCREKWGKIKELDLSAAPAPAPLKSTQGDKTSRKIQAIENDYKQCGSGDIYDILCEICMAISDATRVFEHETTFWSVVAVENPESKFTSSLRRRAFWAAIDEYSTQALSEAKTLAAKAKAVKKRMEALEGKGEIEFSWTYVAKPKKKVGETVQKAEDAKGGTARGEAGSAELSSEKKEEKKSKSKKSKKATDVAVNHADGQDAAKRKATPKTKPVYKSADVIENSDEEEEEEEKRGRSRLRTEERSLGSASPELSPSTFVELCKGGKRVRGERGGKVKKGRREGMKA